MKDTIKTILFLLTYKCNLKCKYCFYNINDMQHNGIKDEKQDRQELTLDEIDRFILQPAKKSKVKRIIFSGGEPMIRKDILQLLRKTIEYGMKCILQSNLTLDIDNLLNDELVMNNVYFRVSLDGIEEQNDKVRGMGAYNKTNNNISKILKYYEDNGKKSRLSINTVIVPSNIDNLDVHIKKLIDMGIDSISLQVLSRNRFDKQANMSKQEISKMLFILKKIALIMNDKNMKLDVFPIDVANMNYENLFKWYNGDDFFVWHGCSTIRKRLTISPYGDVFTCIENPYASLREKRIEDIINDEREEFIKKMEKNAPVQECFRCCNLEV